MVYRDSLVLTNYYPDVCFIIAGVISYCRVYDQVGNNSFIVCLLSISLCIRAAVPTASLAYEKNHPIYLAVFLATAQFC